MRDVGANRGRADPAVAGGIHPIVAFQSHKSASTLSLRVLTADLPGVDPGSVDVDVDNGTLTISAHRTARSDESVRWLTSERFFGKFRRQLSLGEGIDAEKISATYENGVLTVTIPMSEKAKPRKIDVGHGGEQTSIQTHTTVDSE